jgi:hypothetical protein
MNPNKPDITQRRRQKNICMIEMYTTNGNEDLITTVPKVIHIPITEKIKLSMETVTSISGFKNSVFHSHHPKQSL